MRFTIILLFGLLIVFSSFNPYWLNVIVFPYGNMMGLFVRIAYLIYSFVISILFLCIFEMKERWSDSFLSKWGKDTVFFYLLHPYILYVIVRIWSLHHSTINLIDALMITVITMIILVYLRKLNFIYSFVS